MKLQSKRLAGGESERALRAFERAARDVQMALRWAPAELAGEAMVALAEFEAEHERDGKVAEVYIAAVLGAF